MSEFTFKDSRGSTWDLKLNMAIARSIDNSDYSNVTEVPFSFISPTEEFFREVYANTAFTMALVWTIVQNQVEDNLAKKLNLSLDDETVDWELKFIEGLDGDAVHYARRSLLRALADFYPPHRTVLLQFVNQMDKMMKMTEIQMESMEKDISTAIETQMKEATEKLRQQLRDDGLSVEPGETLTKPSDVSNSLEERFRNIR